MGRVKVKVAGRLDLSWDQWLVGFTVTHSGQDETTLVGDVRDQAELYGLIAKLRDLGVKLISVNLIEKSPDDIN